MCVEGVEGGSGLLFCGPTLITGPLAMWRLCQHLLSPRLGTMCVIQAWWQGCQLYRMRPIGHHTSECCVV